VHEKKATKSVLPAVQYTFKNGVSKVANSVLDVATAACVLP
jgi:hypothetical protein